MSLEGAAQPLENENNDKGPKIEGIGYKFNDKVNVVRSSGDKEDDWLFGGYNGETVTVHKPGPDGKELVKRVKTEDFLSWQ